MRSMVTRLRRVVLEKEGVALPLALLGLISVSLLVTTALVTSSTELAISGAHQDATRGLYVAEGGLQAFVAEHGGELDAYAADFSSSLQPFRYPLPGGGEAVDLSVVHLGTQVVGPNSRALRVFSVRSTPAGGGRSLTVLVKQVSQDNSLPVNITAPLAVGGGVSAPSNDWLVSGADQCGAEASLPALRYRQGQALPTEPENRLHRFTTEVGGTTVDGSTDPGAVLQEVSTSSDQFARDLLQGKTLDEIIALVPDENKLGPRFGGPSDFTLREPRGVYVIDADGGDRSITGGEGVLIILNGNLEMQGGRFDGIIIVEGKIRMRNHLFYGPATVSGAVITLSRDVETGTDLGAVNDLEDSTTIRYNSCEVAEAMEQFSELAETVQVEGHLTWVESAS